MSPELQNSLLEKYPKIFIKSEGIFCEDGWYNIIDNLCQKIQSYVDREEDTQTRIFKITNQYGGLHINAFTDSIDAIEDYIEEAETLAATTCEYTGLPGELHCRGSLYVVTTPQKAKELKLVPLRKHKYN